MEISMTLIQFLSYSNIAFYTIIAKTKPFIPFDFRFIAILPGLIPKTNKKMLFFEGGLTASNPKLPFAFVTHKIASRRVFLFPGRFRVPSDYNEAINSPKYVIRKC